MTPTLSNPSPVFLDLTGLPGPVVERVRTIVADARAELPATQDESAPVPQFVSRPPKLSRQDMKALLDEMASMSSGQSLPIDFSRADIYDDHD
jgi:hypothetical protein